nr:PREDICTED: uncharacterized protein LOC109035401 [Bemisia tabaci]
MRADTASWLAAGVAGPLVGVWLGWAALIVYSHRAQWRLLDPLLLALLLLALARQLAAAALTAVHLLRPSDDWCSALAFLLAAADAMQAATLATLVFSKFLHLRLPRDKFRKTLSKSHLIYHLACLVLISSCIGVAAVIGKTDHCVYYSDKRYISFWLTLHSALIVLSFCVLIYSSCLRGSVGTSVSNTYYQNQRRLLLNSSSDLSCALSDISMLSSKSRNRGVNYSVSNCSSNLNRRHCLVEELLRNQVYVNGDCKFVYNTQLSCGSGSVLNDKLSASQQMLTEELRVPEEARLMEDSASCAALHDCHLSTTTTSPSSTNSRAPVLAAKHRRPDLEVQLITVAAVSVLCFFTSHLPVMLRLGAQGTTECKVVVSAAAIAPKCVY